jgi:hypothetical protein
MRTHAVFPDEFPEAWASDWGEDEYGIFMGFTYKRVRQDFRWWDHQRMNRHVTMTKPSTK